LADMADLIALEALSEHFLPIYHVNSARVLARRHAAVASIDQRPHSGPAAGCADRLDSSTSAHGLRSAWSGLFGGVGGVGGRVGRGAGACHRLLTELRDCTDDP
jgi:hypothetical protein